MDKTATWIVIPSGKHLHKYGKSPFRIGKSTVKGPVSIAILNYKRVTMVFTGSTYDPTVLAMLTLVPRSDFMLAPMGPPKIFLGIRGRGIIRYFDGIIRYFWNHV